MPRSKKPAPPTAIWLEWLQTETLASPSAAAWEALVSLIAEHPPLPSEVALIDAALVDWPDHLRTAPEAWMLASSRRKQPVPHWSLVRTVCFHALYSNASVSLTPARIRWLLSSPAMAKVRHLTLRYYSEGKLPDAILEGLAKSQALSGLKTLDLYSCGLGHSGLKAVTEATWLTSLERLNLDHRFMAFAWSSHEPEAAVQLRAATHLSNLTDLRLNLLSGTELLEAVLEAPHLANVTTLHLGGRSCSDELIRQMVKDPRRWRDLELGDQISPEGARLLAENLDALESLVLTGPIRIEGVLALLENKKIDYLVLHRTDITGADAQRLTQHPRPGQLRHFMCKSSKT